MRHILRPAALPGWIPVFLVLAALAAALPAAAQSVTGSGGVGPVRAPALARVTPAWRADAAGSFPLVAARNPSARNVAIMLAMITVGAALTYHGEQVRDTAGFPGSMLRYTGYALLAGGVGGLLEEF